MGYKIKGFVTNSIFVENTVGVVSDLCELSPLSKTFAKELGVYHIPSKYPNTQLTTFTTYDDELKQIVPLTEYFSDIILQIANTLCHKAITSSSTINKDSILLELISLFGNIIENIEIGELVTSYDYVLPESIFFTFKETPDIKDTVVRLWFVDSSFQSQYDDYEITIIPPIDILDDFFKPAARVKELVEGRSFNDFVQKIQNAKEEYPETVVKLENYDWVNPLNNENKIPTNWGILIYGLNGDNDDAIKDALEEFILKNSTHTRDEWKEIFPDIFKRTEFIITPMWVNIAIPNLLVEKGIYSPITNIEKAITITKKTAFNYSEDHIRAFIGIMSHHHRQVALSIIGGPENRDSKYALTDFYPDYIGVSNTSFDFNRMTIATQEWANELSRTLEVAERYSENSVPPKGISKIIREDILYFSIRVNKVNYLIVAKSNFK